MNFIQQLMKAPVVDAPKKRQGKSTGPQAIKAKAHGRYRLIMEGNELTTGEIAAKRGITHMGCLSSLYQMESEGLIERVGTRPTGGTKPTVVWRWKK